VGHLEGIGDSGQAGIQARIANLPTGGERGDQVIGAGERFGEWRSLARGVVQLQVEQDDALHSRIEVRLHRLGLRRIGRPRRATFAALGRCREPGSGLLGYVEIWPSRIRRRQPGDRSLLEDVGQRARRDEDGRRGGDAFLEEAAPVGRGVIVSLVVVGHGRYLWCALDLRVRLR
jgi:hypothetical protein